MSVEKTYRYVQGIRGTIYDDKIWMFDRRINALFSMEIKTGKTEYILSVEDEPKYQGSLVGHIICYENKMLLNPAVAKAAVLVDLETLQQSKIFLGRKKNPYGVNNANVIQEGSRVYMLPKFYGDPVLVYDFAENKMNQVEIDYGLIRQNGVNPEEFRWGSGCRTEDGYCLIAVTVPGLLYLKDDGESEYYQADTENTGFGNSILVGDDLYLLPYQGKDIMVFHIKGRKFEKVAFSPQIVHKCGNPYVTLECYDDKLYFFPGDEENIVQFNLKTQEIILYSAGENKYYDCKVYGEKIYGLPYMGKDIVVIDTHTNEMRKMCMPFPENCGGTMFADYWIHHVSCQEHEKGLYGERVISIRNFAERILNPDTDSIRGNHDSCGSEIWKEILKSV